MFESRNEAIGFAQRTRKNLEYVRQSFERGENVHVVTHLVNSLLGIVVVPKERYDSASFWSISLTELGQRGWPTWNITMDTPLGNKPKTENLGNLITHLRNAAAHGRFTFGGDSNSRYLSDVELIVEDAPALGQPSNWMAEIGGPDLYQFCLRLADYIEESIV